MMLFQSLLTSKFISYRIPSLIKNSTFSLIAKGETSSSYIGPLLNFLSIFLGSLVVGVIIAILCALIIKNFLSTHKDPSKETYSEHDHEQSTETILMVIIPWIAYLIGEVLKYL